MPKLTIFDQNREKLKWSQIQILPNQRNPSRIIMKSFNFKLLAEPFWCLNLSRFSQNWNKTNACKRLVFCMYNFDEMVTWISGRCHEQGIVGHSDVGPTLLVTSGFWYRLLVPEADIKRVNVGDQNGWNCHQYLIVVTITKCLQHPSPTSM